MKIKLNTFGFHEVLDKPSDEELKEYYSSKYYQQTKGTYEKTYNDEELKYIYNKIEQKQYVLERDFNVSSAQEKTLLDIGSGEGWVLAYFKKQGWKVTGLDYSEFGCSSFNPGCLEDLKIGDIYTSIKEIKSHNHKYTVIWLDNVLEHVTDPLSLLKDCREMVNSDGILIVEVPNDFSLLQQYLKQKKYVDHDYWVALPDHLSYFNKAGLLNLAQAAGWESKFVMTDYPIDFSLINPDTNYTQDRSKGKNCNKSRIEIDNLMHSISTAKTVEYYRALADLGLGRQIIAFFKPVTNLQ